MQREESVVVLAAREARRAAEVDRGPAGEPARRREVAIEGGSIRLAFDDDGIIQASADRRRVRFGRLPEAVADVDGGARPDRCSPGPVPGPRSGVRVPDRLLEHRAAHAVPRAVAVRDPRTRDGVRRRSPTDRDRPGRAAAPQPAQPRRHAVRRTRSGWSSTSSRPSRHSRRGIEILDYDGFRKQQADALEQGRYIGVGISNYVEPTIARDGLDRNGGRHHPHRAVGRDERLHRGRLGREQRRDDRGAARGRRARHGHRRRADHPGRHRGHGLRRWHRWEPHGLDDRRRHRRDRSLLARSDQGDRGPPARGRGRRHRAG